MKPVLLAFSLLCVINLLQAQDSAMVHSADTVKGKIPAEAVFKTVQVPARFPGGIEAWVEFLQKNLNTKLGKKYIPLSRGQQSAEQIALVSFIVTKEGKVTEVTNIGTGPLHPKLAGEAIRVISKSPDWIPAVQDGKKVNYRQIQTITFQAVWKD